MRPLHLLGIPLTSATARDLADRARAARRAGRGEYCATLDLLGLERQLDDPGYRASLLSASAVLLDGAGLLLAAKLLGRAAPPRSPGADLFRALAALAADEGLRLFLYGARPAVLARLERRLRADHPRIVICGRLDGYGATTADAEAAIRRARPDLLFVALGAPRQEKFLHALPADLGHALALGVGGSFDVRAGALRRAPAALQRLGLEWLFRLMQEPFRFARIARLPFALARVLARARMHSDSSAPGKETP